MAPTDAGTERNVPPKATLFCPDCGHQSRYDGDWITVQNRRGTHYRCPDCHTEITTRMSHTDGRSPRFLDDCWHAWDHGVRVWHGLLQRLLSP
ncbi:hypothetical protein Harman_06090 [Haloarcula mannanilytica]|uniref:DUF8106 domain-containing protein n=1 Tax=Haloarcula mannanilytica TaxID=2509225 RepID=A0A4C2EEB3_9EURY|nr:hypothetical protein [Haloarcula mannanilytica]GCF12674.1 hypothetical protein Harman_06090 [Haloarcula mannanilytica]